MNEAEFAYRIRQALDEGANQIDYTVSLRLEMLRKRALDRSVATASAPLWVPALQVAAAGGSGISSGRAGFSAWMFRFGVVAPLVALAIGIVGIKQWQSDNLVAEVADLDFAVLLDDTPIDTYAHSGFGEYLKTEQAASAM